MSDMPLPSFQIDQAQLRELRIAKRWTAESAAMELRCQLGKGGCKPEPPKIPSPKIQPRHERIQVDHLAIAWKV
jgi:hypothetical protein